MFLPTLLLSALCSVLPGQDTWFEVVRGGENVTEGALARVQGLAEVGLERLRASFPGTPTRRFSIVVHRGVESLPPAVRAGHHPGSPGLVLLDRWEVHILLRESAAQGTDGLRGTVDHELAHVLLHQYAGPCAARLPRWLHEGIAQMLAGDTYLGGREEDLVWRARADQLLRLPEMREDFPARADQMRLAYAHSYSFVSFLERRLGLQTLLDAARTCDGDLDFERALVRSTRRSLVSFETEWIDYLIHDSGATFRVVLNNCFSYLLILAVPILALAAIRRLNRDRRVGHRLAEREAAGDAEREPPESSGP